MNRKTRRGNNPAIPSDGLMKQFLFMTGVVTVMIVLIIAGVVTLVAALKVLVPALEPAETRDIVDVLEEIQNELGSGVTFYRVPTPTPVNAETVMNSVADMWERVKEVAGGLYKFTLHGTKGDVLCQISVETTNNYTLDCGLANGRTKVLEITNEALDSLKNGQLPPSWRKALEDLGVQINNVPDFVKLMLHLK